ncbi:MAG: class I SAM-dependent methyltransferase [Actinobacteria bacterium]|nr:class I SAM-dependent methyltransferase [Actinomycetota bacterium]
MPAGARFDGLAEYYEEALGPFVLSTAPVVGQLLGSGDGSCVDLGCGVGLLISTVEHLGWKVIGVDLSRDQLRRAGTRAGVQRRLVCADVHELPFPQKSMDAVLCTFVHTDVEDYSAAVHEACRVLRPGGRFVHIGLHPCFVGPFSRYRGPEEAPELFRGYRETEWTDDAPGFGVGLRRRVGSRHVPLAGLMNAIAENGLKVVRVEEPPGYEFPRVLAMAAIKD